MFNFMKKSGGAAEEDDKNKRKKDKKERKEKVKRDRGNMSSEELLRIDEVRRSLKLRGRRKEKDKLPSGITADYSANFLASFDERYADYCNYPPVQEYGQQSTTDNNIRNSNILHSDSSETSLNSLNRPDLPALPPRPPKRGILKGQRSSNQLDVNVNGQSVTENTLHNEVITYQDPPNFTKKVIHSPIDRQALYINNINNNPSLSPSGESLTESTTNSSFVTPPFSMSPSGEWEDDGRWCVELDGLPLPEVKSPPLPPPRILTIHRQGAPRNDFGFSLRRAMIVERGVNGGDDLDQEIDGVRMRTVVFAEPGTNHCSRETGLFPGDRLLEVNGCCVDDKNREQIIEMIKACPNTVTVKVQPVSELSEVWKRWAALDESQQFDTSLSVSASESETNEDEKEGEAVWVCHRSGFSQAQRLEGPNEQGRSNIKLAHSGQKMLLDDDHIEKANPSQFDLVEDLASLRYLNESSALHVLRQRYAANLVHTCAGHSLLLIQPLAPLTIYSDKISSLFKAGKIDDLPPHLFAQAQRAYRSMLISRRDHALVFMGRRSSGKSSALRRCALYLAQSKAQGAERIRAALGILGGACGSTAMGSRAATLLQLQYDQTGALASAALHAHLLDITRVPTAHGQRTDAIFDIFNWVIHGCKGEIRKLLLLSGVRSGNEESGDMARLVSWLADLNISEKEQLALFKILAAIYHLASAGATKAGGGGGNRFQFSDPVAADCAARLLGCCTEELSRILFSTSGSGLLTPTQPRPAFRTPSPIDKANEKDVSGQDALEGLINGLYMEFFNCLLALINRCLTTEAHTVSSLILVDPPGLGSCNGTGGAQSLHQLATNYLLERLQLLAHEKAVLAPRAVCRQEGVPLIDGDSDEDFLSEVVNPGPLVELLDRAPQNSVIRTSQIDLRDVDRKGLLWLLDEESMHPGASDSSFVERVVGQWGASTGPHQHLIRRGNHPTHFILHHMQSTYPVIYNASGWVKASRENPVTRNAVYILQESTNEDISRLFVWSRGLCGAGPDAQASLRRASSIRRTLTTGAVVVNRRSMVAHIQNGVEGVLGTLRRSRPLFIFCALAKKPQTEKMVTSKDNEIPLDVPLLRSQFRGFQLLDAARMYKQGFPDSLLFAEFARRFRLLATNQQDSLQSLSSSTADEQRRLVEEMLMSIDLDPSLYRIGLSQVLLRAGALTSLESARDERLRACIVQLQARARGLLARRALARRRVQHVAAKCIQRNVRAFLAVRDWPWWRLYIRVAPLLSVNRTEDMLKKTTEELEIMRTKLEKIEAERAGLKHENDKLENKLSEMTAELAVEQSAGSLAAERLSAETSERLRLEKELQGLRTLNTTLQQTSEKLETELMYTRAETNGSIGEGSEDGSEDGVTVGGYKRRLQAVLRELEATRRQLRQQHEDDLEQLVTVKKQLEKKVADAYEEVEEQRQVAAQWKRKAQKAASDGNDLRLLADEQGARAALLDKRQKRCDAESHQMQEEIRREKQTKERIQRELDLANAEKYALEQSVADLKMELEMKEDKLTTAQRELDDMTFSGKTEEEVGALKRAKHELEKKCHDQEEELDEMAGQLQLLESHKVRLEMSLEQQRKAARLEAAQRDEELEEARAQATKKVKALEAQLETEHSERTLLLRERHELERRLSTLEESSRAEAAERDAREQKAKRDLRRARALALDAQAVLEKREKDSNAKAQLRQLRDKLDDAEVSLRAAVKARQAAEAELAESTSTCEEAVRARREAESRAAAAQRDATAAQTQLEEAEEEAAEVMKKYRACVQALSEEQRACREATARAIVAEEEARAAKDRADELTARLASIDNTHNVGHAAQHDVLELKTKDLEARLELEQTARSRLEAQATRARDAAASSSQAASAAQARELAAAEELRKTMRSVRELREEVSTLNVKLEEAVRARNAAEAKLESERSDTSGIRQELRNAQTRIAMLQQAIVDELSPNNNSDSENDSYSSDESLETFLTNHKIGALSKVTGSVTPRSGEGRQSRSSASSSKQLSPTKESYA